MQTEQQLQVLRTGYWASLVALLGAVGYFLSALLQVLGLLNDMHDSVLAYAASLLMPAPFLVAMLALHAVTPLERRFWSMAGVAFAVVYTTYNTLNYVVQLATVLPGGYTWNLDNHAGTQGPLMLLNQTPHSLFWDIDGLGYIFLNIALLFTVPLFARSGLEHRVRGIFIANAAITPLFAITYFAPGYSVPILMLGGIPWAITVPASLIVLALFFRHRMKIRPAIAVEGRRSFDKPVSNGT